MEKFDYVVDGEPVSWTRLIQMAKELGWEPGWMQTTSAAARYLRENYACKIAVYHEQTMETSR